MKTKTGKFALIALFTFSIVTTSFSQNEAGSTEATECNRYKAIAGNAFRVKEYKKVSWAYGKALDECESFGMAFYKPYIYALKHTMRDAKDKATKDAYLDTLINVYEQAQKEHGLQKEWQSYLAYSYLKQGKSGAMKKADEAYNIGVHYEKEKVNTGFLQQYYQNLYNLWVQEQDEEKKDAYKKRIISDYFVLSDYANDGNMGVEATNFLSQYLNQVVTNCESIVPEIEKFITDLPQAIEAKKASVNNFMKLLEEKNCTKSDVYEKLVDTIIKIDPSVNAVLAKAKLLVSKGQVSNAINTFNKAIAMTDSAEFKSGIQLDIARAYFNAGSYKSAHNAGIAVDGKYSAKGYEIAARSVNALTDECGVSTFQRKANNYYAVELAEKSGNSNLINQFKKQCPSQDEVFNASKAVGDEVTLSCWGKSYKIKLY